MPEGTEGGTAAAGAGTGEGANGEAGNEQQGWKTGIAEELRGHDVFKGMEKAGDVHQKLIDLHEKSANAIYKPTEGASVEDVSAYQIKLGRPEAIEGYTGDKPKDWPEELGFDEKLMSSMKQAAFDSGVSATAFEKMVSTYLTAEREAYNEMNKSIEDNKKKSLEAIEKLWPGDKFKENNAKVFEGITKFAAKAGIPEELGGVEGFKEWLTLKGLTTDPMHNYVWSKLGELIGEDFFLTGGVGGGKTPDVLDSMFSRSMPQ